MGGTSTDVCVYYDKINIKDENIIDGIIVNTPCFDIVTVAAGGGSVLEFENGMFKVGPKSSGANPGPICYDRNGLLSLTDANLYMGNIDVTHLPSIFGFDNKSPLNYGKVEEKFLNMSQ
jgi:5-oxoprolinase (ATP-hydrolysing)